jgi:hypothetical protein
VDRGRPGQGGGELCGVCCRQGAEAERVQLRGDTIEGDLTRPDGEYIEALKRVPHSNLIRIREEYRDKVMQSVDEL